MDTSHFAFWIFTFIRFGPVRIGTKITSLLEVKVDAWSLFFSRWPNGLRGTWALSILTYRVASTDWSVPTMTSLLDESRHLVISKSDSFKPVIFCILTRNCLTRLSAGARWKGKALPCSICCLWEQKNIIILIWRKMKIIVICQRN